MTSLRQPTISNDRRRTRGFTLVEMLVVIAIVAVMGTMGVAVMQWLFPESALSTTAHRIASVTEAARDEAALIGRQVYIEYRLGESERDPQSFRAIRAPLPGEEEDYEDLEFDLAMTLWMEVPKEIRIVALRTGEEEINEGYFSFVAEADGTIAGHVVVVELLEYSERWSVQVSGLLNEANVIHNDVETVFLYEEDF